MTRSIEYAPTIVVSVTHCRSKAGCRISADSFFLSALCSQEVLVNNFANVVLKGFSHTHTRVSEKYGDSKKAG